MVKRYSFDRESEIVNQDFSSLIDIIGGKGAGYNLLQSLTNLLNFPQSLV